MNGLGPDSESPGTPTGGSTSILVLFPVGGGVRGFLAKKTRSQTDPTAYFRVYHLNTYVTLFTMFENGSYIVGTCQNLTNAANFEGRHPSTVGETGGF